MQQQPNQRFPFGILLVGVVLLLPSISFPMGMDQAAFFHGGRTLIEGGTLYVDYIDVKPPLIYQLYSVGSWMFGASQQSFRWFDLTWQTLTLIALLWVLQGAQARRSWQWVSTITYSMLYVNLNYGNTAQVEGFAALPLLLATGLWLRGHTVVRDVLIGACIAMLLLLKYTLAGVVVVLFVYDLLHLKEQMNSAVRGLKVILGRMLLIGASCVVAILALLLPLLVQPGFLDGWRTVLSYLTIYASHPPFSLSLVRDALKTSGVEAGDVVSLAVSVCAIIGISSILNRNIGEKQRALLEMCAILVVGLLFTVLIERKFWHYHFSRLYPLIAILSGFGMAVTIDYIRERIRGAGIRSAVVVSIFLILGATLSPLPRYVSVGAVALKSIRDPHAYDAYFTRPEGRAMNFGVFRDVEQRLNARVKPNQSVMFMTIEASMIVPFVHSAQRTSFADSHLFLGTGVPDVWHQLAYKQLKRSDWLVVDTDDNSTLINMHNRSSMQSLIADPLLGEEFERSFVLTDSVDVLRIYRRISSN